MGHLKHFVLRLKIKTASNSQSLTEILILLTFYALMCFRTVTKGFSLKMKYKNLKRGYSLKKSDVLKQYTSTIYNLILIVVK